MQCQNRCDGIARELKEFPGFFAGTNNGILALLIRSEHGARGGDPSPAVRGGTGLMVDVFYKKPSVFYKKLMVDVFKKNAREILEGVPGLVPLFLQRSMGVRDGTSLCGT